MVPRREVDVPTEASVRADEVPQISRRFRLQFEPAQSAWVLLYPEGMVRLSQSAGEIMKRMRLSLAHQRGLGNLCIAETNF